jgi:hypothetical protein
VTGCAIDKALLWFYLEILHLSELVIYRSVHHSHLSRCFLWTFLVAAEILFNVTVSAGYAKSPAVTEVHDVNDLRRRQILEPWELYVLEDLGRWLLFSSSKAFSDLFYIPVVDLLDRSLR